MMELESNCSAVEYVGENEVIANSSGKLANNETKINNNGTYYSETNKKKDDVLDATNSPLPSQVTVKSSSPSPSPSSPSPSSPSSPSLSPVATKGKGLKKWKRVKRDGSGGGASGQDSGKLLKRALPNSVANSNKPFQFSASAEAKKNSEGSLSSTKARVRNFDGLVDHLAPVGDSGLVIGPNLAAGMHSGNSEDHSSKSSTAASGPKLKNKVKNPSGKLLGNSVERGIQGKAQAETSKKHKEEVVKIEKENSHSSLESDLLSSKFLFEQGINFMNYNGRQIEISIDFVGENSDDALGSEQQLSGELQAGSNRLDSVDFEVTSQENFEAHSSSAVKQEKSESSGPSGDIDPLMESIIMLQSAQEELEKEVERFRGIGKDDPNDELAGLELLQSDDILLQSSDALGTEVSSLKQKVNLLESELDDATALLKVKEAKIVELEVILNHKLPNEETSLVLQLHEENYRDMEIELEDLFMRKIEAEVEQLAFSRTFQQLGVAVVGQITILEEQNLEQMQLLSKLQDTEVMAARLKEETEKFESYYEDIAISGETIKLKTRVCEYATCFFLQLILVFAVLTLFLWQLSPHSSEVVPT